MIAGRRSRATEPNQHISEIEKPSDAAIDDYLHLLIGDGVTDGIMLLAGGTNLHHFRLRVAQGHLRDNLTPSNWSHIGILMGPRSSMRVWEVPLDPPNGFVDMPRSNGIQASLLARYSDLRQFPNVALLRFPTATTDIEAAIRQVRDERGMLDLPALILPWLGFVWGAGLPGNPLLAGNGIPSAVFVEAVFAALGMELAPGLATQSSCPEAIWQAARWWHDFYAGRGARAVEDSAQPVGVDTSGSAASVPSGYYWVTQPYAAIVP